MAPATPTGDICSVLQIDGINGNSEKFIADVFNSALLEPMHEYQPLDCLDTIDVNSEVIKLDVSSVHTSLRTLNPRKAPGPDEIPNWLLKEYADFLADPVCSILNTSFAEQALPNSWKHANVIPLAKKKPVTIITKHVRPISLTPTLSKLAEDFVVRYYVGPAVLEVIDPNQFSAIPKSSTTHALISMVHKWASATDGTGAAVRIVLLDYRKAFDLIDHRILVDKILSLRIPPGVARWECDFLMNRFQRVKLSNNCYSEWGAVPSGVPQGTKLGPWLFLLMINDLQPSDGHCWKNVDDATLAEVVRREGLSNMQNAVSDVERWSTENKLQLNADKCKEMVIDFKKVKHHFHTISVNSKELELVDSVKILGITISNSLQWFNHVNEVVKKANKRLYFLILLKRANVPVHDIFSFYCTCIRPVLEYCAPVFHHALPGYLSDDLERIQKRALSIISPYLSYSDSLTTFNIGTLKDRRQKLCKNLFDNVVRNKDHKLHHLLPPENTPYYNLRRHRPFDCPAARTNRFKNSFIISMSMN